MRVFEDSQRGSEPEASRPRTFSLSVLAMVEVGKMSAIDGLLFASPGNHRTSMVLDALQGKRAHRLKLNAMNLYRCSCITSHS